MIGFGSRYCGTLDEHPRSEATVRTSWRRLLGTLAVGASAAVMTLAGPVPAAEAAPAPAVGPLVFPGMEIRQDRNVCTLGFVDVATRTAYTAGHCRAGDGAVTNPAGLPLGQGTLFQDNTPDGTTITTDHLISDWQTIALAPDVTVNDVLPGGRALVVDPTVVPTNGQRVCHFGVVTGESCGTIESVNNGWFTMTNGIVSQKGDSGGPVYVPTDDGRAVIIGMFNSTWGSFPAAVSWQSTDQQIRDEVVKTSGTANPAVDAAARVTVPPSSDAPA